MAVQIAELTGLPGLLVRLSRRDDELESLTDNAAEVELQRWNRLLQTIEEDYVRLDQFNEAMERLFRTDIDPSGLTDLQLERRIDVYAEADKLGRGSLVDTLEDLVTSSRKLLRIARGLSLLETFAQSDDFSRLRQHAQKSLETRERTLELARRWRDEQVTLKHLGELSRRRPLTKREKILLLYASIIYTPVVQDPSDSREDLYDYDVS